MRDTIRKSANRYSRKQRAPVSNAVAAANCRALLASMSTAGRVDREQFTVEMQSRSLEHNGRPLTADQLRLLTKIVDAYEDESKLTAVST